MRKIILRSFLVSSIFAFATAPALAQDAGTESTQKFADPDRLIEIVLAGDASDLEATLEELDGALLAAQTDLDQATTDVQQAETDLLQVQTDTADAIQAIDDAKVAVSGTQFELGSATLDLETAQEDLATLEAQKAALPTGITDSELDAQIAALETQIVDVLEPAVLDAGTALQTASDDLALVEEENADAVQALSDAEGAVDTAKTDAGDAQATVDGVNLEIVAAQDGFGAGNAEITALVGQLTPEQLFALNRSLNDTVNTGLVLNFSAEQLQAVIDGDYSKQQINSLTKALEAEARFLAKAEASGDDKFLAKAESQKQKFLSKIDSFSAKDAAKNSVKAASSGAAKIAAKGAAKSAAKDAAKVASKGAAKSAAKLAAKSAAKSAAKTAAKGAAKSAAKSAAKTAAKGAAKSAAKTAAKSAAKSAAKVAAKSAAKNAAKKAARGKS